MRRGPGQTRETALKALKPACMPQRDARTGQDWAGQDRTGRMYGQATTGRQAWAGQDRQGRTGQEAAQDSTSRIGEGERGRRGPGQTRWIPLKVLKPAWMPQRDARTGQDWAGQDRTGLVYGQARKDSTGKEGQGRTGEIEQHRTAPVG
jgi:hypothetical protein